jgi:hypothetical protein
VRRDISSIPQRTAGSTWQRAIDLITGPDSIDAGQLTAASGVMGSIITDEHPAAKPIVVEGVGAQLRIYLRYGMKAVEEGDADDALNWNPTAGDWTMHVPCDSDNLAWVKKSLAGSSPRIKAFDVEEEEAAGSDARSAAMQPGAIVVDWNVR